MNVVSVTAKNVDLSNCDREQIQFSAAVQPHGCMVIVEEPSLTILQVSANTASILGLEPAALLGGNLERLLTRRVTDVAARLRREDLTSGPVHLACLAADETPSKRALNLFGHRIGGATILEFEVIPPGGGARCSTSTPNCAAPSASCRPPKACKRFSIWR